MVKQTPMMQQYMRIRQQYPDALLMYRMGDFYEFFFEDAIIAARDLEIVLTSRSRNAQGEPVPMCGVPWHSVNSYISRLILKGHHVAVCEQVEDPKLSAGIVKREVVRLLTPGTVLEDFLLDENVNNYLAAICDHGNRLGWSYLDVSTGAFYVSEFSGDDREAALERELRRVSPAECLVSRQYCDRVLWQESSIHLHRLENFPEPQQAASILCEQFRCDNLNDFALGDRSAAIAAAAAIISYLKQTQKSGFLHISTIQVLEPKGYMELDSFTRSNLELTQSLRGESRQGTVLAVIDHCCNAMGRRRLRTWLERPLTDRAAIDHRLDAVEELVGEQVMRNQLLNDLKQLYDMERIIGRLGSKAASPRDLLALKNSLALLPEVLNRMTSCKAPLLRSIAAMDTMPDLRIMIEAAIDENAPLNPNDGGVIRSGYHPEVDELRSLSSEGNRWLMEYEAAEREATGIKSLKVSYNKVFGYYIDVTKSNLASVPPHYIRKQTLVNNERFITVELKEYEDKIMRSTERLKELENKLFIELRDRLEPYSPALLQTARLVAELDCLLSLAVCAYLNDYCRPSFTTDGSIDISAGRHPVIELSLTDSRFVPNDLHMTMDGNRFAIITGPNMGGKSTFMRQVALICLLAQMGSFVPADRAKLSIVDRIFTRVGASDNLYGGQSTFMVEMVELAEILSSATAASLIILDEIGRGTSTYDGLSLAQATSEYINRKIKAKTLFATHYHELTELAEKHAPIFNLSVSVIESGDSVTFMKKVLPGKADKSYGIHVARLAGLPSAVIQRADEILLELEASQDVPPADLAMNQASLFAEEQPPLVEELRQLNVDGLSPREAMLLLYKWKEQI